MSTYLSTTDRAAIIRKALKDRGWNSRKVSVTSSSYSMGSSIRVVIRDVTIPKAAVEAIANEHEKIDRCQYSGEILSGGNRYVFVEYDWRVVEDAAKPYVPAVQAAVDQVHDNYLIPIEGTPFMVGRDNNGWLTLWSTGLTGSFLGGMSRNAEEVARAVVARLADAQAKAA